MKILFFRLIDFFWITVVVLAITASFNSSVLVGDKTEKIFRYILPQGWGFFTKKPLESQVELYKVDNKVMKLVDYNNSSPKNALGFSRVSRLKGYELSIILEKVQKDKYIEGKRKDMVKALSLNPVVIEKNEMISFTEKGTYIFKISKPIPWAWANSNQENNTPCSFVKIKIQ